MNWRVRFLAVLILFVFGSFAWVYYRSYVKKRSHGIILFVANGLDLQTLNLARQQAAARGQPLRLELLSHYAFLDVQGLNDLVPDEGAAATALASGVRVKNGLVGCNARGQRLDTLMYAAQRAGRATGLVTTSSVTKPTNVSFYGYIYNNEGADYRNAAELIDTSHIDVILGGGAQYFTPAHVLNEKGRSDNRDLFADAARRGYAVIHTPEELNQIPAWHTRELFGLFAPDQFFYSALKRGSASQPSLADMTRRAIQCLQYNLNGYFLVVEHGLIENAARNNFTQLASNETAALDEAVRTAIDYAGSDTLVMVTNNFGLGALDSTGGDLNVIIGAKPPYQWLTGPGGTPATTEDRLWLKQQLSSGAYGSDRNGLLTPAPATRFARHSEITTSPAWIAARGFGSSRFEGCFPNTDFFRILVDQF